MGPPDLGTKLREIIIDFYLLRRGTHVFESLLRGVPGIVVDARVYDTEVRNFDVLEFKCPPSITWTEIHNGVWEEYVLGANLSEDQALSTPAHML